MPGTSENESYAFTAQQEARLRLNGQLGDLAGEIRAHLETRWKELNVFDHFFITQFGKAHRTFIAIHVLLRESLVEDAPCLLRVLVENTINLKYGIRSNPTQVVRRYWDWATLDSLRRARAANWFEGTKLFSEENKQALLKADAEIRSRYSAEEYDALKRNVFGLSLEKRAEIANLKQLYDASYRVLSRNIHAMDIAVMEVTKTTLSASEHAGLSLERVSHVLNIAQWCLGTLAIWVNDQFGCRFDGRLDELQARAEESS